MQRTHFTQRSTRRAAAANAGLNPREWRQLEQLADGSAWLSAHATVRSLADADDAYRGPRQSSQLCAGPAPTLTQAPYGRLGRVDLER